jgi:hypothetical protein
MEQVIDTMLHELSHNEHGPHDEKFHALWDQLRSEYEALVRKGYSGEGFLSEGRKLGGRSVPRDEARRIARAAAEKRRILTSGSGQKLGGAPLRVGQDIRQVIVNAIERRATITKGCGSGNKKDSEIKDLADQATNNGFKTKAEEDLANQRAIEQAMWELIQEEEKEKFGSSYIQPSAANPSGSSGDNTSSSKDPSNPFNALLDLKSKTSTSRNLRKPSNNLRDPKSKASASGNSSPPVIDLTDTKSSSTSLGGIISASRNASNPFSALLDSNPSDSSKNRSGPAHSSRLISPANEAPLHPQPTSKKQRVFPASAVDKGWICSICTCHNPETFLCCDACSVERPLEQLREHVYGNENRPKDRPYVPAPKTWTCHNCRNKMEEQVRGPFFDIEIAADAVLVVDM